jgi:hypothetical protein
MTHALTRTLFVAALFSTLPITASAQKLSSTPVKACSLLPKSEVKKHLPWMDALDNMPLEETPIGSSGSSCNYPNAHIQIFGFHPNNIAELKKQGPLETLSGVGDEAWYRNNRNRYAEVYVRKGAYAVTVQGSSNVSIDVAKTGAINLAKALVAKLP